MQGIFKLSVNCRNRRAGCGEYPLVCDKCAYKPINAYILRLSTSVLCVFADLEFNGRGGVFWKVALQGALCLSEWR